MDAYDRCTNLVKKNLADIVAIYVQGQELFRPPTYTPGKYQRHTKDFTPKINT